MKSWLWKCSSVLLVLAGSAWADDSECRDKQENCFERVRVNASTFVGGLVDDVPPEVYEAFIEASADCLKCVDYSDLIPLGYGNGGCPTGHCMGCGDYYWELWNTCRECCGECRCQGCYEENWWGLCDDCCDPDDYDRRRLDKDGSSSVQRSVDFNVDVCMEDVSPLDSSSSYYIDYQDLLEDFEEELQACYEDREAFYDSWSDKLAAKGFDLSTLARGGDDTTIMFGMEGIDKEGVQVTTYSSDESHRSTTNMFFYGALGFVCISAFAVVGTAVVVKVLNKRKAERDEQTAKWVSEMVSADVTSPLGESTK